MKKAKSKGRRGRPAPRRRVVKPLEIGGLPAVPEPGTPVEVMQTCPIHASVTFRHGGFCEKCYADTSMERVKTIDDALADTVVAKFSTLVQQVLNSDNVELIERFLGRVMARFDKPKQSQVSATLKAVHLHAPVDFGRRNE
jgi:hypothetical protein